MKVLLLTFFFYTYALVASIEYHLMINYFHHRKRKISRGEALRKTANGKTMKSFFFYASLEMNFSIPRYISLFIEKPYLHVC